ncbi:hypothetical protein CXU17_04290 [Akkermansia muciniphila]|nr:hypothetical protein CXU17_04290 [Akkermansia muciniphila]
MWFRRFQQLLGLGRADDGKGVRGEFIRLRGQAVFRQQVFRVQAGLRFQPGEGQQVVPSVPPSGDAILQRMTVVGISGWS